MFSLQAEVSLVAQTKTVSTQFISKLLKKLIGSRHLDCHYGLALLHYFPLEEATNWIMESTKRWVNDWCKSTPKEKPII